MRNKKLNIMLIFIMLLGINGCIDSNENKGQRNNLAVEKTSNANFENSISYVVNRKVSSNSLLKSKLIETEKLNVLRKNYKNGINKTIVKRYNAENKLLDILISDDKEAKLYDGNMKLIRNFKISEMENKMNKNIPLKLLSVTGTRNNKISMKIPFEEIKKISSKLNLNLKKTTKNKNGYVLKEETPNFKMSIFYDSLNEEITASQLIQKQGNTYYDSSTYFKYGEIDGKKVLEKQITVYETRDTLEKKEYTEEEEKAKLKEALGGGNITFVEDSSEVDMNKIPDENKIAIPTIGREQLVIEETYENIKLNQNIDEKEFIAMGGE